MTSRTRDTQVCVIGAGPAGLATARALKLAGISYTQIERHTDVGGIWDIDNPGTPMYESAHFISSKTLSGFSGFPMPDAYPDYPSYRQILGYLRDFATAYDLYAQIEFGTAVKSVEKISASRWEVVRANGEVSIHDAVVVCTGVQWDPFLPELPGSFSGQVMHARDYREPSVFAGKRVLVVGAGNSGCDIACDAARTASAAHISMRRGYWFIPKHIFGKPVDAFAASGPKLPLWLEQRVFGAMLYLLQGKPERLGLPRPDHRLFETHPIINSQLWHHLQHGDIQPHGGIADTAGSTVRFTDGSSAEVDLVLFATGYHHSVPVAPEYFPGEHHPDLYLCSFSRAHRNLFGVGFIETNSGAYHLFDMQAHLIANYLRAQDDAPNIAAGFDRQIQDDQKSLLGGLKLVDSRRHAGYVDSATYTKYVRRLGKKFGWQLGVKNGV